VEDLFLGVARVQKESQCLATLVRRKLLRDEVGKIDDADPSAFHLLSVSGGIAVFLVRLLSWVLVVEAGD